MESRKSLDYSPFNVQDATSTKHLEKTQFQEFNSDASVSPSPDPDSFIKTFDFSSVDGITDVPDLSAALQTEREFIDFMFSLPQIQKEAIEKGHGHEVQQQPIQYQTEEEEHQQTDDCTHVQQNDKKISGRISGVGPVTTRVGLDHLDNLCRMMEQLTDLKEQNSRLQRRVQYLEDLKTLQEMHRDMHDSLEVQNSSVRLTSLNLSDSELHLEELTDAPITGDAPEDSLAAPQLVSRISKQHAKGT